MAMMLCAVCLAGCAGSGLSNSVPAGGSFTATPAAEAAAKLTAAGTPGNSAYKIGPLDVVDVTVFKVPDLSRSAQVSGDGTFNYPLVGNVEAAGKTTKQLETELTQKLGSKYLRNPQVTVFVKEYNSQRVTVEGAVKTSGVYAIKGKTTLTQVLAMAGDVNGEIGSGDVVVFRTIDGKRSAAKFDYDEIRSGKALDPEVEAGDVVVADTSSTKIALSTVLKILPAATTAAIFVPLM